MAAGRTGRRYGAEFMGRQLARARVRGWSLVRLARESGISLPTLSRWRRRLDESAPTNGFVEVVPARRAVGRGDGGGIALEIELRGGHRIALSGGIDAATVERVLSLLSRPC
jgi:hypothetical protein